MEVGDFAIAVTLAGTLVQLAPPILTKIMVDNALNIGTATTETDVAEKIRLLWFVVAGLVAIRIVSMVTEMIGHFEGMQQKKIRIAGLKRVRFKLPVRPQDTVTLALSREKAGRVFTYAFQAWVKEELACAGVVLAEQAGIG